MKHQLSLFAILLAFAVFSSCGNTKKSEKTEEHEEITEHAEHKVAEDDCEHVHWSHHDGEDGPANWKNLCSGFSECGGKVQSPINIITAEVSTENTLAAPVFSYGKSAVEIINNEHTVQFNVSGENTVNLNGKEYKLLQFHYHALSEHTYNGEHFPLEVHFVHQHSDNDFAVIGIMFEEGDENELFAKYIDKFPTSKGEFKSEDVLDVFSLLPKNKSYFNYNGSLTTPPCSEVVNWYMLKTPLTASLEQIEAFSKILDHNYRPVLPTNERIVSAFVE